MKLLEFCKLFKKIQRHMKWDEATTFYWFDAINPNLGQASPMHMIALGRGHKVLSFVDAQIDLSSAPNRKRVKK